MTAQPDASQPSRIGSLPWLRQRLKPIWYYGSAWPAWLLRSIRYWKDAPFLRGSRDVIGILQAAKTFVRDEAPQAMGLDPETHVQMELPRFGSASFVLILSAGGRKAILRTFPLSDKDRAKAHVEATELALRHGMNVPRILLSSLDGKRYPAAFTLDEFIEGQVLAGDQLSAEQISAMAGQIARMHMIKNEGWGRVSAERPQPFFLGLTKRVKRDTGILERRGLITRAEAKEVRNWVKLWEPEFEARRDFSLTHNDILPANGLFTADGQYYMIDLNRLQWDVPAREVVRCYYRQFRGAKAAIEEFNRSYFSRLPQEQAQETWRFCRFYEMFYRMSALVKMTPKLGKYTKKQRIYEERQKVLLTELMELVRQPFEQTTDIPGQPVTD